MKKIEGRKLIEGKTYWVRINAFSRAHPFVENLDEHKIPVHYVGPVKFVEYENRDNWNNKNCHIVSPIAIKHLTYHQTLRDCHGEWYQSKEYSAYLLEKDYEVLEIEDE